MRPHPTIAQRLMVSRRLPAPYLPGLAFLASTLALVMLPILYTNAQSAVAAEVTDNIPPASEAMVQAIQRMQAAHCHSNECAALKAIWDTLDILYQAHVTTTQLGGWTSANIRTVEEKTNPRLVHRRLRETLLEHPQQFSAICTIISDMVSMFGQSKANFDEEYINITGMYQIALLIDAQKPQRCLARAIAAMPPEADRRSTHYNYDIIQNARDVCLNSQWRIKACDLIRKPTSH